VGYGAHYLADAAKVVTGIDMARGNAPRAAAKYLRPNLRFLHMEGSRPNFPDGSFDLVCNFQVIEHVPEPQLPAFVAEMRRLLAPGGLCCLSTLNLEHNMKPGKPYQKLCYHEKEFTGPQLRALLSRSFPSVELHGLYLSPTHRLYQRLKKWGLHRLGSTALNPIARFYEHVTVDDFVTKPSVSRDALDLIAVCSSGSSPAAP
jgi:2-polyprenyl-3-methyl-5-hydroxy-6-metoxy-1,4-benzoquinol methylase